MNACNFDDDCSKVPIPGKCVAYCLEQMLRVATPEENQLILGLDESLSTAIYNTYHAFPVRSFEDLKKGLTNQQTDALMEKFKNINQFQLNYFRRSRSEREPVINIIKELNLDMDNDALLSGRV